MRQGQKKIQVENKSDIVKPRLNSVMGAAYTEHYFNIVLLVGELGLTPVWRVLQPYHGMSVHVGRKHQVIQILDIYQLGNATEHRYDANKTVPRLNMNGLL